MEVYWLVMVIQVMSSTSHVVHVGNFHLRSECEQAARDATRPATIGTPSDHAAYYCVRAYKQRVVMHSPPPGRTATRTRVRMPSRPCASPRDFYGRAQKISPARAGPSQREETPPVQGHL